MKSHFFLLPTSHYLISFLLWVVCFLSDFCRFFFSRINNFLMPCSYSYLFSFLTSMPCFLLDIFFYLQFPSKNIGFAERLLSSCCEVSTPFSILSLFFFFWTRCKTFHWCNVKLSLSAFVVFACFGSVICTNTSTGKFVPLQHFTFPSLSGSIVMTRILEGAFHVILLWSQPCPRVFEISKEKDLSVLEAWEECLFVGFFLVRKLPLRKMKKMYKGI